MLTFVGLGLFDKNDISEKGRTFIAEAEKVYIECYTSRLMGTSLKELENYYKKSIHPLSREDVEQHPDELLKEATTSNVAFLTVGDPMISTTHIDLRLRAATIGIKTAIIHGVSISTAIYGLTGLQNYRFGKSCSLPFPKKNWFPMTPIDVIAANLTQNLHTLVYLDIQNDRFMTIQEAIDLLEEMAYKKDLNIPIYIGIARAGSDNPVVSAGPVERIRKIDFGSPLHILVIPAELHDMERKYLEIFAGL